MIEDFSSSFLDENPFVIVLNYPAGFWHLDRLIEINPAQKWVKSEVLYILSKSVAPANGLECGTLIKPNLENIRALNQWVDTYLKESWQDFIQHIIRIQELQLKNYRYELGLLEFDYNQEKLRPVAHLIYSLEEKIKKVNRAASILQSAVSDPAGVVQ